MGQRIKDPNDEYALLWLAFAQSIADCRAVMRGLALRADPQLPGPAVPQLAASDADLLASSYLKRRACRARRSTIALTMPSVNWEPGAQRLDLCPHAAFDSLIVIRDEAVQDLDD